MKPVFYITSPDWSGRAKYFPARLIAQLEEMGSVRMNERGHDLTEDELCADAADADVVLTHWGAPQITKKYLNANPGLRLIAHCAGSVAGITSADAYERGVPCISANSIMAKFVAEAVLGLMIASMRGFKENDVNLQGGVWTKSLPAMSLFDPQVTVGLIGLGTVGRELLTLLEPFGTRVLVYDPYLPAGALDSWKNASLTDFAGALGADVVSVHASKTPETYHMMNADAFAQMRDGAVFINTARGALVDTEAAACAIRAKHLRAAFDVYEKEHCPQPVLSHIDGVLLQPHVAAIPAGAAMTEAVIADIGRFLRGEGLTLEVSRAQFDRMTKE